MHKLAALLLCISFVWSTNAYSGCECLCSHFKTRGGERKMCARIPKGDLCDLWYQQVPNVNSRAACIGLGENEAACQGYAFLSDRWTEIVDGRYHSCVFY